MFHNKAKNIKLSLHSAPFVGINGLLDTTLKSIKVTSFKMDRIEHYECVQSINWNSKLKEIVHFEIHF